jgi:hypothetical protein
VECFGLIDKLPEFLCRSYVDALLRDLLLQRLGLLHEPISFHVHVHFRSVLPWRRRRLLLLQLGIGNRHRARRWAAWC